MKMPEVDTSGLTDNLTRKVGPLPLYAWAGVAVGAFAIFKLIGGRGSSGGSTTVETLGTGSVPDLSGGGTGTDNTASGDTIDAQTLKDIQDQLDAIAKDVGNSNPGKVEFPAWFKTWLQNQKNKGGGNGGGHNKPPTGDRVIIPYIVQAGDTWAKLAKSHGMTLQQFYALNPKLPKDAHHQRGGGRKIKVWQ